MTSGPFASDSVWNLPIAVDAVFAGDDDPRNGAMHDTGDDGSGLVWVNSHRYSHPITFAGPDCPPATVVDVVNGGRWNDPIPSDARIAGGDDAHMHVVSADRSRVHEYFGVTRMSPVFYEVRRRAVVPLRGPGIGPQQGVRAYGGSAIGGLIRRVEVDPAHPLHTGRIDHALAVALRTDQLYMDRAAWSGDYGYYDSGELDVGRHPGWPTGTPANGFMRQTGYVWPATEQDYQSPTEYSGTIPMGSYFAIPGSVDVTALGITTVQGLMLARAAQQYGVYVTDASGAMAFYTEDDAGPATEFADSLLSANDYTGRDPRIVFNALRVVVNNTSVTPNGGPLGAPRLGD
ncbi:hypothetical protein [Pseudonocardia alni]|uniref:hypothetical protein n=1 Tax=Pseudonocardia alni TaxID=33907 RepID=UPI00279CB6EC|nr:hypothetical protein PaSha_17420 [Pseudonocardia alni]